MISEFSPRIGPIPTSYALSSKNYFYNNLSVIAKGPEFQGHPTGNFEKKT